MSTVCLITPAILFAFCVLFFVVGRAGQPKAVLARAYREACVCSSQVGTRVQGVPGQHRPLHEPSGPPDR